MRVCSKCEEDVMAKAKSAVPEGFHTVTPQLTLDNAAQGHRLVQEGAWASEVSRAVGPDGKIMHAELQIGNSKIMVNDAMMGSKGPRALGGSPISLWLYVDDCDALFNRAITAGAKTQEGPMGKVSDQFWGDRAGTLIRSGRISVDDRHPQGRFDEAGIGSANGGVHEERRAAARAPLRTHPHEREGHGGVEPSCPFLELSGVARVEQPCDAPDDLAGARKFRKRLRLFARLREFDRQGIVTIVD
jgi:PhnB protein